MITATVSVLVIFAVLFCWMFEQQQTVRRFDHERETWVQERQQLLDRIQAPTFGEYKQAEVKVIKAQKAGPEPAPLEPL